MPMTDQELRERLFVLGYFPPPITDTSRSILLKKLRSLETGSNMVPENNVDGDLAENESSEYENFIPVLHKTEKVKSWDKLRLLGTIMLIICSAFFMFYVFQLIGDWSDRRYRNLLLTDVEFPVCEHFRNVNCIPQSQAQFTQSNLNIVKASLHHIILKYYCGRKKPDEISDSVGMYPSLKKEEIHKVLTKELDFTSNDAKILIENSELVFNLNPKLDVRVQNEQFIYKNYRLLRSCGYMPWKEYGYTYALYLFASFTIVILTYQLNHWVRGDDGPEIEYLMNNLLDILQQGKEKNVDFVFVEQARQWLISPEDQVRKARLWGLLLKTIDKKRTKIHLKTKKIDGIELEVFCLE